MAQELKATPEVQALLDAGRQANLAGNNDQAATLYDQALAKAREFKDRKGEGDALRGRGNVYKDTGQPQKALEFYQQSLTLSLAVEDKGGEANTLRNIGLVYEDTGQPQKALEFLNQALPIFRTLGDKSGEANTLYNIGIGYSSLNDMVKALEFYNQALTLYRTMGDKEREVSLLNSIGIVYWFTGQAQKAIELYSQALALARAVGGRRGEANALNNIGLAYKSTGQPQKALEFYNQALTIHTEIGGKNGKANALNGIGAVHRETGRLQKAFEFYNQALALYREIGSKEGEANALNNIGIVYDSTGQPQKAFEFYNQALALYREIGSKGGEANALNNIGVVYWFTNQLQKALEFYNQALTIQRQTGDKGGEANTLHNIGGVYKNTGQAQKAIELYSQALALARAIGEKRGEANTLNNLGEVYKKNSQPQKALELYNQALTITRAIEDKEAEAEALNNLGRVYDSTGQPQKALEFYNRALTIRREIGDKGGEASTLNNMALVEVKLKQPAQAETHFAQAVTLYETLRENLGGLSEAKSAFLGSTIATYYSYLNFLLEHGKTDKAFEIAQKTKARSLLDLMATGRVNFTAELTTEERDQEEELRQTANFLNAQMVNEGVQNETGAKTRYAALKEQLMQTESQLQTLTDTLYARHPGLAQKRAAKTATQADMVKLLPADTALLDYIVLAKDKLALFVVTRGTVQAFTLPLAYKSLVSKASAFRAACADPRKDYKPAATELYKLLLAPAAKQLTGAKRLVVCPDGALWDIPFQALLVNGQFLAQRYELAYAYSATGAQAALTVKASRKKPTQTLLALANPDFGSSQRFGDLDDLPGQRPIVAPDRPISAPDRNLGSPISETLARGKGIVALPGTQREAEALKKLFPSATLMTGKSAQESVAKAEAGKYRYLHFATHGFFNDASPLLSSLVLAAPVSPGSVSPGSSLATPNNGGKGVPPLLGVAVSAAGGNAMGGEDGFLTAREIFDLDLSAEMVVLSACNTARGVQRTGDGVIGLTWALFVAGCPTQVVSQWSVDDASTATLMTRFYGNLVSKKRGKGAALRQASLALMADPKHAHPYYWAPFVLMGDWR